MSLTELPPGQEKTAGPRWWTRVSYVGLVILGVLSVTALVVGVVASRSIAAAGDVPAKVEASQPTDPVAEVCRPPVERATREPWIGPDGPSQAEDVWKQHAEELGRQYLVGPNGWVFWSDYMELNASQAVGRRNLTQAEVDRWIDYYTSIRDGLAAEGIPFYIVAAPSTSSIYPEELPAWMADVRGSTILDQLLASAADLPIIDLRSSLISAKQSETHLYSWTNSHWTDYGGYVGWTRIAACINAMNPSGDPLLVPEVAGARVAYDSNEWANYGVPSRGADWAEPVFASPLAPVTVRSDDGSSETVPGERVMDLSFLPATTTVENPWAKQSALVVRDSMGNAISPYLQQAYSPLWQVGHIYDSFDQFPDYRALVAKYHPDVVILEVAERHFTQVPPVGAAY